MLSCLTEFNEEVFRKGIHEEGFAEGQAKERQESIIKAIEMSKSYKVSKEDTIEQLIKNYELSEADAKKAVDDHWK